MFFATKNTKTTKKYSLKLGLPDRFFVDFVGVVAESFSHAISRHPRFGHHPHP